MPWRLLRFALSEQAPGTADVPRRRSSPAYDVVIIGAGGHGLASAYNLAQHHGIRIAVLEKGYIGSGNTGRNTTIIRSNYLTPEGVRFYDRSVQLWRDLGDELGLNLFYSTRGHYTLAHTDATLRTLRWRAEVNKHLGVDSRVVESRRDRARAADDGHELRRPCADCRRAVPRARRRGAARCGGLGLCARGGPARRGDPPADRSAGHRRPRAGASAACAPRAATSPPTAWCAQWPATRRASCRCWG